MMREVCELRVDETDAGLVFRPDEGVRLGDSLIGFTRKVEIRSDDPRFPRIGELDKELRRTRDWGFYTCWRFIRQYTKAETAAAELFEMSITAVFEPAGNQCGTVYDFSASCPECNAPDVQKTDLILDLRKAPKTRDIARSIADEWIVSQRLAGLMVDAGLTGFDLAPVRHKGRYQDDAMDFRAVPTGKEILRRAERAGCPHRSPEFWNWLNRIEQRELSERMTQEWVVMRSERERPRGKPPPVWYQLVITSPRVSTVSPTRFGINPFDDDPGGEYRCSRLDSDQVGEHVAGCNVLSELFADRNSHNGSDIVCTRQRVGWPNRIVQASGLGEGGGGGTPFLLISPRFRNLLLENKIRGWKTDVAYLS